MTDIKNNLKKVQASISNAAQAAGRDPQEIKLIAVSKRKPAEAVLEALEAGAVHFGENYIQEAVEKIELVNSDQAIWHFIGHLQSNKAKIAVKYFEYIHTVDSVKLAGVIDRQAEKIGKTQKIFMQINIGMENSKSGVAPEDAAALAEEISGLKNIRLCGLMGMPPWFEDPEKVRKYFKQMTEIKDRITTAALQNVALTELSMGMSGDFEVAIQEGSTMVRVGTSIFGERS